jgi:hypothetical protein
VRAPARGRLPRGRGPGPRATAPAPEPPLLGDTHGWRYSSPAGALVGHLRLGGNEIELPGLPSPTDRGAACRAAASRC